MKEKIIDGIKIFHTELPDNERQNNSVSQDAPAQPKVMVREHTETIDERTMEQKQLMQPAAQNASSYSKGLIMYPGGLASMSPDLNY